MYVSLYSCLVSGGMLLMKVEVQLKVIVFAFVSALSFMFVFVFVCLSVFVSWVMVPVRKAGF